MKFAREFRDALANEGFPARWVQHAVPYGELKKCLKKVRPYLSRLPWEWSMRCECPRSFRA
jgi:E3 ubiquitin-protein ligase BAH